MKSLHVSPTVFDAFSAFDEVVDQAAAADERIAAAHVLHMGDGATHVVDTGKVAGAETLPVLNAAHIGVLTFAKEWIAL